MKSNRMLGMSLLGAALATLTWAGVALAGNTYRAEVVINTSTSTASGTTYSARVSTDTLQRIDCGVGGSSSGGAYVTCTAVDKTGLAKQCTSSAAAIVAAAQSIVDYAYLYFTWNASGNCTNLYVYPGSRYLP